MISLKEFQSTAKLRKQNLKKVEEIPVNQIRPNPYQPRKSFTQKGLEELSRSIMEYGVIQPITVKKTGIASYELITGERRLRASKMIGMEYIPAIIVSGSETDSAVLAMIENLQRENLHFLEEAKGIYSLLHDHSLTQEELAKKLGKNQSTIANKIRLLKLPDVVKEMVFQFNLTERHARALLKLPDEELQVKVIKKIIEKNSNVKETENMIERILSKIQTVSGKKEKKRKMIRSYKDLRVFVNTIKNAVIMMKEYGLSPEFTQVDKGDVIEIRVIIPKG